MKPHFEIVYLNVTWYDKDTVARIAESFLPLGVEFNNNLGAFECYSTVYPKANTYDYGQLAFRFVSDDGSIPYIETKDGSKNIDLKPLFDKDTGRTWWIEALSWDGKSKRWRYKSFNTAGTIKFILQNKECLVHQGSFDFTAEELNKYLEDFKRDLWEIILDDQSYVLGGGKSNTVTSVNEDVLQLFSKLIAHTEKLLLLPKSELREFQTLKPRRQVKPVNRTFMELATKTNHRFLTSRASQPSYDVAENQYVLFILQRCYRILRQIVALSDNKSKRYAQNIQHLQDQHDSLTDHVHINRDLVVRDLEKLKAEKKPEYWTKKFYDKFEALNSDDPSQEESFLGRPVYKYWEVECSNPTKQGGHFATIRDPEGNNLNAGRTVFLHFAKPLFEVEALFEKGVNYRIFAYVDAAVGSTWTRLTVHNIKNVEVVGGTKLRKAKDQFYRERDLGRSLHEDSWRKKLNKRELEEQGREKKALQNRIFFYGNQKEISSRVHEFLAPKQQKLQALISSMKKLGIKPKSTFPNSMAFVQNPHYQGVHVIYKNLRAITKLTDDDVFLQLEEIEKIGLGSVPLLYERWCLLQIMKVLTEQFGFEPQSNWQRNLIEMVRKKDVNLEIKLTNDKAKRNICVSYEKVMLNGKRPDFVLDVEWEAAEASKSDYFQTEADTISEEKVPNKSRFVLDAKFYDSATFDRLGGLHGVVDSLFTTKNYSENGQNSVFVLHPCKTALGEQKTPQTWGQHSDLGEGVIKSNDARPMHKFGAIYLTPTHRFAFLDELQRLLGLFLQYSIEDSNTSANSRNSDLVVSQPICIRCGSTDFREVKKGVARRYTTRSFWCECNVCGQFTSYNHCTCDTRLIKSGAYWTYHSALALDPFNVKCPDCGNLGAWSASIS